MKPNKRFGKDININEKLKEFYKEIKKHNIKDIICIDETSISALQKRHHCYNDVGKRCVILDNASSHRNELIRNLVNKDNKLIYSVPYQHFTNAIEHYFSILKSRLQKLEGLTYNELKLNIRKVIKDIPKETYKNLLIGSYKRDVVYVKKPSRKSSKKSKTYKE